MGLRLIGVCLLFLLNPQIGLAEEEAGEPEQAGDAADQALEREELGSSLGSDDLAEMGRDNDGPIAIPDIRRRSSGGRVMDEMALDRTEITGNQELPTVMYIVPWQKSDPGELMGRPVNSLLDEVLAPIDRSEFIRQVEYYGELNATDED